MDIDKAFEEFMEFPQGSNEKTVTTVSCKLFAKWYSEQLQERIKVLEQRIINLQGHDDLSYIDKKLSEQESKWVGLTDDEVNSWELPDTPTVFEFAQFIEAKLKEKNGD